MKGGVIMVALFLIACSVLTEASYHIEDAAAAAAAPKSAPKWPWYHEIDPKVAKCFRDLATARGTCIPEIAKSYWTRKLAVQPDCCKAVQEADEDCAATCFHNVYFGMWLKAACANAN